MTPFRPLVSTEWMAARLGDSNIKIIDGSWRMPGASPARHDYEKRHIEGAVFFDIDAIADQETHLPHMLPSRDIFEAAAGALGVSNKDTVVVYDDAGCFSAARIWWTFRVMGHQRIAVMDGGLPKWLAENRPVTDAALSPPPAAYAASFQPERVSNAADVRARLNTPDSVILDARPAPRFHGEASEPREGLRSGHMPGATSLPHALVLNEDHTFINDEKLAALFASAGVTREKQVVTSCGSGVTAAVLSLALELAGHRDHKLYDGSWRNGEITAMMRRSFPLSPQQTKKNSVEVTITYLEQTERPPLTQAPHPPRKLAILRAENPPTHFYRYIYRLVGEPYCWVSRRRLDDGALTKIIHDPNVFIYILYVDGVPGGFAEVDARAASTHEIKFFGLTPDFTGAGLGRYFLTNIIDLAWSHGAKRLLLETCTLDHPAALPLYQRLGFRVFDRKKGIVDLIDPAQEAI